jgi:hypothetical protein
MATYPSIIGASQAKQQRMNKIYGATATTAVRPARLQAHKSKGKSNMFKRMIRGLVSWAHKEDHGQDIVIADREEPRVSATGIKFEVYRANGGTVVETRRYNRKNDENVYELHVITDSQDVGQAIGQIITMEALKS